MPEDFDKPADTRGGDNQEEDPELHSARDLLVDQEYEVSDEFLERVRAKIERRTTVAQFSSFSWRVTGMVFVELFRFIGFVPQAIRGGDRWKSRKS